jgi:predicted Zn-dependent protease
MQLLAHRRITPEERRRLAVIEVAEALREEPGNVNALILQAELKQDPKARLESAEQLIKSNPDEPRVWTLYSRVLGSSEHATSDVQPMLERAAEVAPDDFLVLNQLAWYYATHGTPDKGVKLAARAVRLAPWSAATMDTYAAVLAGVGRCADAVTAQKRAVDLIPERAPEEMRAKLQGRLSEYEQRCVEKASAR